MAEDTKSHSAFFGIDDAKKVGLGGRLRVEQWPIWRLYAKYLVLGPDVQVYEGRRASHVSF